MLSIVSLRRDIMEQISGRDKWFGPSRSQFRYWIALVTVLFAVMFSLHTPAITETVAPTGIPTDFRANIGVFAPLVFVPAAIVGYLNEGVLLSFLLAASLVFGAFLPSALFDTSDFSVPLIPVLRTALLVTVLVGGVGFVIGSGLRQLTARWTGE